MATVVVKVLGAAPKELSASNVAEVKRQLGLQNHSASLNGDPASDNDSLSENDFVTLSPAVKGGM